MLNVLGPDDAFGNDLGSGALLAGGIWARGDARSPRLGILSAACSFSETSSLM